MATKTRKTSKANNPGPKPQVVSVAFAAELRKWWSFDNYQHHTHSWHTREDFIDKRLPELLEQVRSEMFLESRQRIECSKCGHNIVEHVECLGQRFVRCRNCGHESEPKPTMPPMRSSEDGPLAAAYRRSQTETQKF